MLQWIQRCFDLEFLRYLYHEYHRLLIPGALLFGFVTDLLTFRLIDFNMALLILCGHLLFAAFSITLINFYEEGILRHRFFEYGRVAAPLVIQYTFGALFSAFLIFYSHSGSLFANWPFLLMLIFLMIANELFRKYNTRPDIQLSVYFFALFSFANLALPYLIRHLSSWVFVLSGILSLALITALVWFLYRYVEQVRQLLYTIVIGIGVLFVAMNFLYFSNWIPPIPLALRDIGIYYQVERVAPGEYEAVQRQEVFFERIWPGQRFQINDTQRAVAFSAVFAPAQMELEMVHHWEFWEPDSGWTTISEASFRVRGGRDEGFRWYSAVDKLREGDWRVSVKTDRGQVLGRHSFEVYRSDEPVRKRRIAK